MLLNSNEQSSASADKQESFSLWLLGLAARSRLAYTDELYQETLVLILRIRVLYLSIAGISNITTLVS